MFETAMMEEKKGAQGVLSFSGSIFLQASVVAGLIFSSLLLPIGMPEVPALDIRPPAPRFKDAIKIARTSPTGNPARSSLLPPRRFLPPISNSTPTAIARSVEFGEGPVITGSNDGPSMGDPSGPIGAMPSIAAPPKPKPVPPAQPAPNAPSRLAIGGNVLAAQIVHRPSPAYPPLARQARIQGVVLLKGIISREGRIMELRVISGHPLLTKAALDAVSQWVYRPTFLNGQAVEVEAPIEVRFVLGQ